MIGALARKFFGSANDRRIKGYQPRVDAINALEPEVAALSDEALKARTVEFRKQLADGKTLDDILVPAFAGLHLGDVALMQHHAADQLHVEMARASTSSPSTITSPGPTPNGWARSTTSSASPSASSCTGSTTASARKPMRATSPTAPTTNTASTICATT